MHCASNLHVPNLVSPRAVLLRLPGCRCVRAVCAELGVAVCSPTLVAAKCMRRAWCDSVHIYIGCLALRGRTLKTPRQRSALNSQPSESTPPPGHRKRSKWTFFLKGFLALPAPAQKRREGSNQSDPATQPAQATGRRDDAYMQLMRPCARLSASARAAQARTHIRNLCVHTHVYLRPRAPEVFFTTLFSDNSALLYFI